MTLTNIIITAYCACKLCCGPSADGITASGVRPVEGVTIAGPRNIPFGTRVVVSLPNGQRLSRVVQDRMSKRFPARWDVYFRSHRDAVTFGKNIGRVEIKVEK